MRRDPKELLLGGVKTPNDNLLAHDDRDGQRGIRRALAALGDRGRFLFLSWCCRMQKIDRNVRVGQNLRPTVGYGGRKTPDFYPVDEATSDMAMLTIQFGLSASVALEELERRAKKASRQG